MSFFESKMINLSEEEESPRTSQTVSEASEGFLGGDTFMKVCER